ncbi:hypothetical protein ABPG72_020864 [Tetrahymena utriculariae]
MNEIINNRSFSKTKSHLIDGTQQSRNTSKIIDQNGISNLLTHNDYSKEDQKMLSSKVVKNSNNCQVDGDIMIIMHEVKQILRSQKNESQSEETLNYIGTFFISMNMQEDAKECYLKTLNINHQNVLANTNLGQLYLLTDMLEEAKQLFLKSLLFNPRDAETLSNLGQLYYRLNMFEQAKEYYLSALQIDPYLLGALNNLGVLYQDLNFFRRGFRMLIEGLRDQPFKYKYSQQFRKSLLRYVQARRDTSKKFNNAGCFGMLFNNLIQRKQKKATQKLQLLIHKNIESYIKLGLVYEEKGIKNNAYYNLAFLFHSMNMLNKDRQCYKKILKINPLDLQTINNLAFLYEDMNIFQKSRKYYLKSLQSDPQNVKNQRFLKQMSSKL